jgi:hypothetical protein
LAVICGVGVAGKANAFIRPMADGSISGSVELNGYTSRIEVPPVDAVEFDGGSRITVEPGLFPFIGE